MVPFDVVHRCGGLQPIQVIICMSSVRNRKGHISPVARIQWHTQCQCKAAYFESFFAKLGRTREMMVDGDEMMTISGFACLD